MTIYDFGRWEVSMVNGEKHREIMWAIYANIGTNRARFSHLLSSRLYTLKDKLRSTETWMYLDEFKDQDGYEKNCRSLTEDKRATELRVQWESLIVPGTFKTELWTEAARDLWLA